MCLVINKCDAPDTLDRWEVDLALRLPDLAALYPRRLAVIYASALRGEAVADLLEWMLAARAAAGAAAALEEGGAAAGAAGRGEGWCSQPGGGGGGGG